MRHRPSLDRHSRPGEPGAEHPFVIGDPQPIFMKEEGLLILSILNRRLQKHYLDTSLAFLLHFWSNKVLPFNILAYAIKYKYNKLALL